MAVQFKAACRPKFIAFWDDVGNPSWSSMHLADCLCRVSFRGYGPLSLPLSCKVDQKRWFLGPRFVGGRDIPEFGHEFSNCTYFQPCGRFLLSSVQRARRLDGQKRKKKKESVVKHKSADNYVGRLDKNLSSGKCIV